MKLTEQQIENLARVTHETNRAYCVTLGDTSQPSWDDAPDWQRTSAIMGATGIAEGRITSPEQSHESWLEHKRADGWKYGPVKDVEAKEHPCFVPYHELPEEQRVKDALFWGVVRAMLAGYGATAPLQLTMVPGGLTDVGGVPVRAWRVTAGAPEGTIAYVHRVAVPADKDATEFQRQLQEMAPPPEPARSFSTRML